MKLRFWKKKSDVDPNIQAWNLMVTAIDPERCWGMASGFRETKVPGSVLTCETSFLMGSIVREIIRSTFADVRQQPAITSAETAYFKTFDDQSDEELPEEMKRVYGNIRLGEIARVALKEYGENDDVLFLTSSIFVRRIKGDPRMMYEIMPTFEDARQILMRALTSVLRS